MLNSSIKFSEHLYNLYVEIVEWVVENISDSDNTKDYTIGNYGL
jgi:hypothetical protein